ncbi:hypothetical protein THF1C08_50080 [Vibrio jasicida]|uniref:Uncharacterized protein n=1 Tax=Vibrio jasicida TaxID=766224 RepID=A0AAU9QVS6_9VIBR|nr:hypothetical protein THF1C08_50080 [Vibrio jasicida]CAH1601854.1 hypothetical protein THF1A12_50268 [Vibrio jasicida]
MISDTIVELASIYGRVNCSPVRNGKYLLEINGKAALLFNETFVWSICHSNCANAYQFNGKNFHSHDFNPDREYLLGLINMAFKQIQMTGVKNAA